MNTDKANACLWRARSPKKMTGTGGEVRMSQATHWPFFLWLSSRTVARNINSVPSNYLTVGDGHVRSFWPMRLALKSAERIWGKHSCFPDERDWCKFQHSFFHLSALYENVELGVAAATLQLWGSQIWSPTSVISSTNAGTHLPPAHCTRVSKDTMKLVCNPNW